MGRDAVKWNWMGVLFCVGLLPLSQIDWDLKKKKGTEEGSIEGGVRREWEVNVPEGEHNQRLKAADSWMGSRGFVCSSAEYSSRKGHRKGAGRKDFSPEGMWMLQPWECSRAGWTDPWVTWCGGGIPAHGRAWDELISEVPPAQTILGLYDSKDGNQGHTVGFEATFWDYLEWRQGENWASWYIECLSLKFKKNSITLIVRYCIDFQELM